MTAPVLVFIHNHRFEENVERLERIYRPRFSRIQHVMPFYRGKNDNVHVAYESSHQFQGYVAQAAKLLCSLGAEHYIFSGDDVLLNARFNEANLIEVLGLDTASGYIKSVTSLAEMPLSWPHMAGALLAFAQNTGVEWRRELPTAEAAAAALEGHGIRAETLGARSFRSGIGVRQIGQLAFYAAKRVQARSRNVQQLPYPLANSYSDFFVVPGIALPAFCHLCGVFAAMNLFAEVAIPTALLMTCDRLQQERATTVRGHELWSKHELTELTAKHNGDLHQLLASFPNDRLYLHPVKLSGWKC